MRYVTEQEAVQYLGLERGALSVRRTRGMPPTWTKGMGEVKYPVEALNALARQEGGRIALHVAQLEQTARTILASTGEAAKPLKHPELEATAHDLAQLLHDAGERELAARLFVAGNSAAERLGKYNNMSPSEAKHLAALLVARVGYLVARNRRLWAKVRWLPDDG